MLILFWLGTAPKKTYRDSCKDSPRNASLHGNLSVVEVAQNAPVLLILIRSGLHLAGFWVTFPIAVINAIDFRVAAYVVRRIRISTTLCNLSASR